MKVTYTDEAITYLNERNHTAAVNLDAEMRGASSVWRPRSSTAPFRGYDPVLR